MGFISALILGTALIDILGVGATLLSLAARLAEFIYRLASSFIDANIVSEMMGYDLCFEAGEQYYNEQQLTLQTKEQNSYFNVMQLKEALRENPLSKENQIRIV